MDVYPAHLLDDCDNYRKLFMSYIFQFNDVLDGQKLADSLSALLEIGDWRKLGGRFQFNVSKTACIDIQCDCPCHDSAANAFQFRKMEILRFESLGNSHPKNRP